tara:strand:- start:169 stop:1050 length:882 start_codon:yes stop_codon:yes gene_type:complete
MPIRTPLKTQLSSSYTLAGSTIEDIDYALYNFINDDLNIFVDTNEGFEKVPVLYSISERAYQIKNDPNLRPNGRTLKYPLITINKTSVVQDPANKGRYGVHTYPIQDYYMRGGAIPIARQVQQSSTQKFANANAIRKSDGGQNTERQTFPGNNENIVYETLFVPQPSYVEMTYNIDVVAEYQQQMNQILTAFHTRAGRRAVFNIRHELNSYEAMFDSGINIDFKSDGIDLTERIFSSTVVIKVLGYLIGDKDNSNVPIIAKHQSPAKIRFSREKSTLGEQPDFHPNRKDKYRP